MIGLQMRAWLELVCDFLCDLYQCESSDHLFAIGNRGERRVDAEKTETHQCFRLLYVFKSE